MTNSPDARAPEVSSYASVNGIEMYYEIHGSGEPLAMIRLSSTRLCQRPNDGDQTMSTGGLSAARLARMHEVMTGHVYGARFRGW